MSWGVFDTLEWLWLVVPLFGLCLLLEWTKKFKLKKFAEGDLLDQMIISLSHGKRFFKLLLLMTALMCVVVGLARPQTEGERVMVQNKGIDIVVAVDVSDSMLAEDIRPNRLAKAKLELQDFVEQTSGDRLAIVAFAGDAYIQVPLTLDMSAVKLFLKTLSPQIIPVPGTSLGRAIEVSLSVFNDKDGEKVLLLLTDGEDFGEKVLEMTQLAAKRGVRIFTVGIGTAKGDVIPMQKGQNGVKFKKDMHGKVVVSKLGEKTLQDIAQLTGGAYYRSRWGMLEVEKIYKAIQSLDQKETGSGWVIEYKPLYQWPILLACILLALQMIISESRRPGKD